MSGDANRARKDVADVMRDLSRVVRGREERSELMETSVEDITPVLSTCQTHSQSLYSESFSARLALGEDGVKYS